MTGRTFLARWLTVVLVALASLATAAPAQAHSSQIGSTPEAGSVLDSPPRDVVVEFDTPLLDIGAAIVVRTADGTVVSTGSPRIERRTIAVSLSPDAPAGAYTVAYRVVSQDGHTVESTFGFQVGASAATPAASAASPSAPQPTPSTATASSADGESIDGGSALPWIVAGMLLLVVIGVGAVLLRR